MAVDVTPARDLDALMAALAEADTRRYSVAWLDCTASGRHAGRGIVTSADHAASAQVAAWGVRDRAPDPDPAPRLGAPPWAPPGLLNRWTVAAFNAAWYAAARRQRGVRQSPARFFHPLDSVAGWNRLYGKAGLVQYQCVVPDVGTLERVLAAVGRAHAPAFLAVLKLFGPADPGPLSFPRPGWTLALDLPAGLGTLPTLLDGLDETVAAAGGSVYLAKDSRVRPALLPDLYPRLDEWRAVRAEVDPKQIWQSDLARRLGL
jgi:decaprenylphospho-beta-D-ribofuranose 2-oxidase